MTRAQWVLLNFEVARWRHLTTLIDLHALRSQSHRCSAIRGMMSRMSRTLSQLWPRMESCLRDADYMLTHNASYDRRILRASCAATKVPTPSSAFISTAAVARKVLSLHPTKLPDGARHLGLELKPHDAGSDARGCAENRPAAFRYDASLKMWAMRGWQSTSTLLCGNLLTMWHLSTIAITPYASAAQPRNWHADSIKNSSL